MASTIASKEIEDSFYFTESNVTFNSLPLNELKKILIFSIIFESFNHLLPSKGIEQILFNTRNNKMTRDKTDFELVDLYLSEDQDKYLSELFLRHRDIAYRTSKRITRNAADAEDIVQISFMEVIKSIKKFRQEGAFLAWFLKIVSHRSLDQIRSNKSRLIRESKHMKTEEYFDESTEDSVNNNILLKSYLNQLPLKYREPIHMKIMEGLSTREVASILVRPEKTIRTHINRGLEKLRASMKTAGTTLSVIVITNLLSQIKLEAAPLNLDFKSTNNSEYQQQEFHQDNHPIFSPTHKLIFGAISLACLAVIVFFTLPESKEKSIPPNNFLKSQTSKLYLNFDSPSSFSFFTVTMGKATPSIKNGLKGTDALQVEDNTIITFNTQKFPTPFKITTFYDMPLTLNLDQLTFEYFIPTDNNEIIYQLHGIREPTKVNFRPNAMYSSVHGQWLKKEIYVYHDHTETWVDGELQQATLNKASKGFSLSFISPTRIENFSITPLLSSKPKMGYEQFSTFLKLREKAIKANISNGDYPVNHPYIKSLFKSSPSLYIYNFSLFLKSFRQKFKPKKNLEK